MNATDDETIHGAIVVVAVVVLLGIVAGAVLFTGGEAQIVVYSSMYAGGVCAFWLGFWALKRRSGRREALQER